MYSLKQARYDPTRNKFMHSLNKAIKETALTNSSVTSYNVAYGNLIDFDYRPSKNQYCTVNSSNAVNLTIQGNIKTPSPIWSGSAQSVRYRESDDMFIVMIEGSSNQVCSLNGTTRAFTSIYSNTGITIAPRAFTIEGDQIYFIASDFHVYSLDISSSSNVPVQITTSVVGTTQSLEYYSEKLYTHSASGTLVEIHVATGQQFEVPGIPSQWFVYGYDFENNIIYAPKSNDQLQIFSYDFTGGDGRAWSLAEGTNTVSNTYIDGQPVTYLGDMRDHVDGSLTNVVFTLSAPTTSTLTLFGTSSNTDGPNVTVEAVSVYSSELTATEVSYNHAAYEVDNSSVLTTSLKYNKIIISHNNYVHFTELELYDIFGTNIARLGTASLSSQFQNAVASIGINGINDGSVAAGDTYNFTSTSGGGSWTLVLDQAYAKDEISTAVFYNRNTGSQAENNRAIGATINMYSLGDADVEEIGVLTGDDKQTFIITERTLLMSVKPSVTVAKIYVSEVDEALSYKVDVFETISGQQIYSQTISSITDVKSTKVVNLTSTTSYTAYLYVDIGNGLESRENAVFDTLQDTLENYDTSVYSDNGKFDLSSIGTAALGLMDKYLNDLFTTGDTLELKVGNKTKTAKFVNRGSTVSVSDSTSLVAPFSDDGGSGQSFNMTLSDTSTVTVLYDETNNSVTINSTSYSPGESLVLDGKKVVVYEI
ncbi:unnamed protein product [Ectocarpus sp. 6 AP-2014]